MKNLARITEIIKIEPSLKECYWLNKKKYDFKHDGTTIGIHIRRGDINGL